MCDEDMLSEHVVSQGDADPDGDGSLLDSLRADVRHKGLQDSCFVVGHCPDMIDTYQAFDMLCGRLISKRG